MALTSYPVSPMYWKSVKQKGWDPPTANLGIYLLTCEHRNLEGLYSLPKMYIASDLAWDLEQLEESFQTVLTDGFVKYDDQVEVILLPKALSFYTPKSPRQIEGAIRALQNVPNTRLWPDFLLAAKTFASSFFEALGGDEELARFQRDNTPPESLPDTHPHTHPNGYAEAV